MPSWRFWPDEIEASKVEYPYRFTSDLVANAFGVPTAYGAPIPEAVSDGIRRAASRAESIVSVDDNEWLNFVDGIDSR